MQTSHPKATTTFSSNHSSM